MEKRNNIRTQRMKKRRENPIKIKDPEKECPKLLNWLKHEDVLFMNRINFLIIAESMLLASFVLIRDRVGENLLNEAFAFCISLAGLALTLSWISVTHKQKVYTTNRIKSTLEKSCNEQCSWYNQISKGRKGIKITTILGYLTPFALLVIWILLLIITFVPEVIL